MRLNFQHKLFLSFALVFTFFAVCVVLVEQARQRSVRKEALVDQLEIYIVPVGRIAAENTPDWQEHMEHLLSLFARPIRVSIIDKEGRVIFDNTVANLGAMDNHLRREEIVQAHTQGQGVAVRTSLSDKKEYIYLARKQGDFFIRVALPYDVQTRDWLRPDNVFLFWLWALFFTLLFVVGKVSGAMGKAIQRLRDFALSAERGGEEIVSFSNDELGEIGAQIALNYKLLQERNREIDYERERLEQHILGSKEGIAFFDADYKLTFFNGLFLQYLNALSDNTYTEPSRLFEEPFFATAYTTFLKKQAEPYYEEQIVYQERMFALRVNRFDDGGIEVVLNDVTANEKTRLLKQEMTANIAHELRTPVTAIRGYLETVLEHSLGEKDRLYFLQQAYGKTLSLSELIRDMSLLAKMEEASQTFAITAIPMGEIRKRLEQDFGILWQAKRIEFEWLVDDNWVVKANETLFYTIFRNLVENALKYAGEGIRLVVELYRKDEEYVYFSLYDTGAGIPEEKHLTRIFERFYRINQGRTRETGGTGLGLSIVKNAVLFHKGDIIVKNRSQGGLEFLFRLKQ